MIASLHVVYRVYAEMKIVQTNDSDRQEGYINNYFVKNLSWSRTFVSVYLSSLDAEWITDGLSCSCLLGGFS